MRLRLPYKHVRLHIYMCPPSAQSLQIGGSNQTALLVKPCYARVVRMVTREQNKQGAYAHHIYMLSAFRKRLRELFFFLTLVTRATP